ncbi:hypothetical protein Tco_1065009 [Tanacetum coccineum]
MMVQALKNLGEDTAALLISHSTPIHTQPSLSKPQGKSPEETEEGQCGEDRMQLTELMDLCTQLQSRVLALETTKSNEALEIESLKKKNEHVKAKIYDDQEETEMKKHIEIVKDDEVAIDAIPLAKPPVIVKYKIVKEGKFVYFQLIRADGSSKIQINDKDLRRILIEKTWRPSGSWLKLNMRIQGQDA